jgi:hypothetical protein
MPLANVPAFTFTGPLMKTTPMQRRAAVSLAILAVTSLVAATPARAQQTIGQCSILPANNIWNTPVDTLPVLSNSASMVSTIGASVGFHADFGSGTWNGGPIGIPFVTVPGSQPKYPATFLYNSESDPGPYAVPLNAPIEGGANSTGDRHAIAVDTTNCILYELYRAFPQSASWTGDSGAIFDLKSNALRPLTWTSADAAGLPIMPGLVTYEEILAGEIKHAIRFTAPQTRNEYVWPARHKASSRTGSQYPRMGERFRLKASFDISPFPADVQVILKAMKKYGIMLADNGSAWYVSGKPDARWNNSNLHALGQLLGASLEAVDATVLRIDPNSGEARQNGISVSVTPAAATLRAGHSLAFSATVTGAPGGVTWSVNNVAGGNTTVGVVDALGFYSAPTLPPSPSTVTVQAASTTSPASAGSATVTIVPMPAISSVSPSPINVGSFLLTVNGVGFTAGSVVWFDGVALPTTVVSSTRVTATGNAAAAKANVPVAVKTTDNEWSNTVTVNVVAQQSGVTITISPTSATVRVGQSRQFQGAVKGAANRLVTYKVNGISGGNSIVGTISPYGLYRAPANVPSPAVVTVTTTSIADPTKSASAVVTITRQ